MDEQAFDRLARGLSAAPSRRRVLSSVLGGVLALLTGVPAIQAQGRGHGLALGVGNRKDRPAVEGAPANHGAGAVATGVRVDPGADAAVDERDDVEVVEGVGPGKGTTKVSICHKPDATGIGRVITVATPALRAHLQHGDAACQNEIPCTVYANGGTCTVNQGVAECACREASVTAEADVVNLDPQEVGGEDEQRGTARHGKGSKREKRRARGAASRAESRER